MAQALHLANGPTVNEKLRNPKSTVSQAIASKSTDAEILDRLFLAALTRRPTIAEKSRLLAVLSAAEDTKDGKESRRQAIEDLYLGIADGK